MYCTKLSLIILFVYMIRVMLLFLKPFDINFILPQETKQSLVQCVLDGKTQFELSIIDLHS